MAIQTFSRCVIAVAVSVAFSGCSSLGGLLTQHRSALLTSVTGQSDAEQHYAVAKYWLKQNRRDEALASLGRVLAIDPQHVEALNARASVRAERGELELARTDLDQALAIAPDREHLHENHRLLSRLIEPRSQAVVLKPTPHESSAALRVSIPDAPAPSQPASGLTVIRVPAAGSDLAPSRTPSITIEPPTAASASPVSSGGHQSLVRIPSFETLPMAALEPRPTEDLRLVGATIESPREAPATPVVIAIAPQPIDAARIDVANGNGINGMARALSGQLQAVGIPLSTISNWWNFSQPVTRVLYREGYEQAARELAARLPVTVELVAVPRLPRLNRDIVVVLGRDMRNFRPTSAGWESLAQVEAQPEV